MTFCPKCDFLLDITNIIPENTKIKNDSKNKIYLVCNNCNYIDNLPPKTVIFKDSISEKSSEDLRILDLRINDKTLPRTKDYICPNAKCASHKNDSNKEAIFFRPIENSYTLKYLCTICKTSWNP